MDSYIENKNYKNTADKWQVKFNEIFNKLLNSTGPHPLKEMSEATFRYEVIKALKALNEMQHFVSCYVTTQIDIHEDTFIHQETELGQTKRIVEYLDNKEE